MSTMQPATILLMALLVTLTVACATPSKQANPYEECMSLCSKEVSDCVRSCYTWKRSATKVMDCINKCNQKSAKCQEQCAKLKEPVLRPRPGYHNQGGDAG